MPKFRTLSVTTVAMVIGIALTPAPADAHQRIPDARPGAIAAGMAAKVWGACGRNTSQYKIVRTFNRLDANDGHGHVLRGGRSNLLCGNVPKFGYRHIVAGHQRDWENAAFMTGENWRDVADFAIATVLSDPDMTTYSGENDTFCFSKVIYLFDKRNQRLVRTKIPKVVIGARNKRVITAFPTNSQCRDELAGT